METSNARQRGRALRALLLLPAVAGATACAYWWLVRPWHRTWGATEEEARRFLPGDEPAPTLRYQSTRAITIRAPATEVWRWLVQIGYGRGGFYSYDWLENLMARLLRGTPGYRSTDRVVPELQDLRAGDFIAAGPPDMLGGRLAEVAGWKVEALEPNRTLVLAGWGTFALEPIDALTTRLIVRTRGADSSMTGERLASALFWEPAHFIMERRMLLGIKARAEAWASRERQTGQADPRQGIDTG